MSAAHRWRLLTLLLAIAGSVLGLAGTDLVLPAVPELPDVLPGTAAGAQLVLASFVAGAGAGLLLFGELGARFDQRGLLALSLGSYALISWLALSASDISQLIGWRFLQGVSGAASAVYAPGIIRIMYPEQQALRAIGVLGSVESLAPALAPVIGVWLLQRYGWQGSFHAIAGVALLLCIAVVAMRRHIPVVPPIRRAGAGYGSLLVRPAFMRYAISQALTLAGLLIFVFGAPAVITRTMSGTLTHFIAMQMVGIASFIVAANSAQWLVARFGKDAMIRFGSVLSACGGLAIVTFAVFGGADPRWLVILFVPMNLGLGLRGPPGFYAAVVAADGNDARGSALVIVFVLLLTALGTAVAAPLIVHGLRPLALISTVVSLLSVACLYWLRGKS